MHSILKQQTLIKVKPQEIRGTAHPSTSSGWTEEIQRILGCFSATLFRKQYITRVALSVVCCYGSGS